MTQSYTAGDLILNITSDASKATVALDKLIVKLNNLSSSITAAVGGMNQISTIAKSVSVADTKWISSLTTKMKNLGKQDMTIIATNFQSLTVAITPFIDKVKSAETALVALNSVMKKSSKVTTVMNNITKEAGKAAGTGSSKTNKALNLGLSLGKLYFIYNYTKRIATTVVKAVDSAIDYQETLNLWQVAMRNNLDLADKFIKKMNRAYSVSETILMQYQATFKNMLSALGMITEDSAYQISEALVQMSLDFSSLYNTTMEKALTTFQAVLAGQVRPIRSISGYDVTENTIYALYEAMGGTKTTRQLSQTEKRLLRILAVFQQMGKSGAIGDLSKTLDNPANQLRIMKEQTKELMMWAGQLAVTWLKTSGILVKINAMLITAKYIIKSLAYEMGYIPEDFLKGLFENVEEGAQSAGDEVDKLQGKLLSFDRFESLNKADSGIGLDIAIDQKILDAISAYNSILSEVDNKALSLSESWLKMLGFTYDAESDMWKLDGAMGGILEKAKEIGTKIAGWGILFAAFMIPTHPFRAFALAFGLLYASSEDFRTSIGKIVEALDVSNAFKVASEYFVIIADAMSEIASIGAGVIEIIASFTMDTDDEEDYETEEGLKSKWGDSIKAKLLIAAVLGLATGSPTIAMGTLVAMFTIDLATTIGKLVSGEGDMVTQGEVNNSGIAVGMIAGGLLGLLATGTPAGFMVGASLGALLALAIQAVTKGIGDAIKELETTLKGRGMDTTATLSALTVGMLAGGLLGGILGGLPGFLIGFAAGGLLAIGIIYVVQEITDAIAKLRTRLESATPLKKAQISGAMIGLIAGGILGFALLGPPGLFVGAGIGALVGYGIGGMFDAIREALKREKDGGNGQTMQNAGYDVGTQFLRGVNSAITPIVIPITVQEFDSSMMGGGVDYLKNSKVTIKPYATGGLIEDGLFTMNRGEMAGKFSDGTSVVANNNQIADGIAQALYPILAKVVQGGNKGGGNVYIDGSIAGKLLEKHTYNEGVRVGHLVPQGGR